MSESELEQAAARLVSLPPLRERARELARREFSADEVGVARYRELYERLAV
jgi:glycosyltransferase involved in cell wall biosynthesis